MGQLGVVFCLGRVAVVGRRRATVRLAEHWCGGFSAWRVILGVLMEMSAGVVCGCG